jgi:hypothetical protein
MLHVHLHILHANEIVSRKNIFFCIMCKKTKLDTNIRIFMRTFFCIDPKNASFHKTLREHIECVDIWMKKYFIFVTYCNLVFC